MAAKRSSIGIATVVIICLILFSIFSVYNISSQTAPTPLVTVIPTDENSPNSHPMIIDPPSITPIKISNNHPPTSTIKSPPSPLLRAPRLHAVTYASHGGRDDRFCRAVESALRHNISLIILGWGVKWTGLSQKLEAAMWYASQLPPDDVLMFTDAFDVMFTNSPSHILQEYLSFQDSSTAMPPHDVDIIFAGECGCWPHVMIDHGRPCFDSYPPAPTPYRYLNSGTWIARAHSAIIMLQKIIKDAGNDFTNANDQKLVADMFIAQRHSNPLSSSSSLTSSPPIELDYHAKLFQSMHMTFDAPLPRCNPSEDLELRQGRYFNKRTKTFPSVFHFNGGGKAHHLAMEKELWYKQSTYQSSEERQHLGKIKLSIPLQGQQQRMIEFRYLCPKYLPGV
jgi:hypothetical protein